MTVTILASVFIALILFIALIGFKTVIKQERAPEDLNTEKCSICREKFNTSMLVERQIGDYKLLFFCQACITKLHNELVSKN
jgi:hypothetical protein